MDYLGVSLTRVDETEEHRLGQIWTDALTGKRYQYVKSGGAIAAGVNCEISAGFVAAAVAAGDLIEGICPVTITAADQYFWLQTGGLYEDANVATGTAAGTLLSAKADANGDFAVIAAFDVTGAHIMRAKALTVEAAGLADVFLF